MSDLLVVAKALNIRVSPSPTAKPAGTPLGLGAIVTPLQKPTNGWVQVRAGPVKGWVSQSYVVPLTLRLLTCIVAEKEMGVHEEGGENRGKRVEEYQREAGTTPGQPWCASYVNWCAKQAALRCGVPSPLEEVPNQAYVQSYVDHFKKLGKTVADLKQVREGDLFCVYHSSEGRYAHIGFVKSVDVKTETFTTREGNSNDDGSREGFEVCSNSRHANNSVLFIQWTD